MPQQRDSLAQQTKYWKIILDNQEIECIYSKVKLEREKISLDHYLPWSFVVHDLYISEFKVSQVDDLLRLEILKKAYEETIIPLISLATIQGFTSGWSY